MNYVTEILANFGFIRIAGPDSSKFLQGQLSCDITQITTKLSSLGAHCNPKGRMLALFRLLLWQNDYFMLLPKSILPETLATLQKYARFCKTQLTDVSAEFACFGCYGESADAMLAEFLAPIPTHINNVVINNNCLLVRIANPNSTTDTFARVLVIGKQPDIISIHKTLLTQASEANAQDWHLLDIQAKLAQLYPQTIATLTPHELNLPALNGVSFSKGCYTGQEVVARMEHLGKLKKHLCLVKLATASQPTPGTAIVGRTAQQPVGRLVDFAATNDNHFIGLALIQDNAIENNTICLADDTSSNIEII